MLFTKNTISIASHLQAQLHRALLSDGIVDIRAAEIPLKRDGDDLPLRYSSAIALKFAQQHAHCAIELAEQVARSILAHTPAHRPDFGVEIAPTGWMTLQLTDRAVADWLQLVLQPFLQSPQGDEPSSGLSCFPAQYAHARCCSLLQLAYREGAIGYSLLEERHMTAIEPIPWLDPECQTLRLRHPAERQLVSQLVNTVDAIATTHPQNYTKLALRLSQSFEEFYSQCRFLGTLPTVNPRLAEVRIGLLGVTQILLQQLLEQKLRISSPIAL